MIPIVENVLTEIIETRLKFIKSNTDIVDRIFSQTTVTMRSRLKEYITSGNVRVIRGFPIDRANLPCYTIMLGGEREQEKALGNVFDDEIGDGYSILGAVETLAVFKKDGSHVVKVLNKPIELINNVTDSDGVPINYALLNERLGLIEILDDDIETVIVDYMYKESGMENYSSLFMTQYRIETWTNNGDLTVMLYHLLKWMLLSARDELEDKGLAVQTIGGLDFEPAPEYFPEFVYRRALTFECLTENSFAKEFGYIQGIDVNSHGEEES